MDTYNLSAVYTQLKDIFDGKTVQAVEVQEDKLSITVQKMLLYLSDCIIEQKKFAGQLCTGDLDAVPPSRNNFLVGELKDLQSGLTHLTWQASRVAEGDYNQKVDFLGEFSDAFNSMTEQLKEREEILRAKANVLEQSTLLMESVVDGMESWLVVVEDTTKEIIYLNNSAKQEVAFVQDPKPACIGQCPVQGYIFATEKMVSNDKIVIFCPEKQRHLEVISYEIEWKGKVAHAHLFSDITHTKEMENIALTDKLTGLNNRWHVMQVLNKYLEEQRKFTICFFDLDGLKYVNDTFGHGVGDQYLLDLTACIKRISRASDTICRTGGDEFLWIIDSELDLSQKLRDRLELVRNDFQAKGTIYPMSFSYGIIGVEEDNVQTKEELIDLADKRMYEYKQKHRKQRKS